MVLHLQNQTQTQNKHTMKTTFEKQIAEWTQVIEALKNKGRTYVTVEWLSEHQILGTVRKTHRRHINEITVDYLTRNVGVLDGFQIL